MDTRFDLSTTSTSQEVVSQRDLCLSSDGWCLWQRGIVSLSDMTTQEPGTESFQEVLGAFNQTFERAQRAWDRSTTAAASREVGRADILFRQLATLVDTSNDVQSRILQNRLRDLTKLRRRVNGDGIGAELPIAPDRPSPPSNNQKLVATVGRRVPRREGEAAPWGVDITDEYRAVRRMIESGKPVVFVTGNAGTGKSTLISYLRNVLKKKLAVVAPTGVAALNAHGMTIHSFFHLPPRMHEDGDIKVSSAPEMYENLELLVIDEVSMVRADLLDSVDLFLRRNRRNPHPFGGVQLLLVGDLFQLPPVVTDDAHEVLQAKEYESPYFFSSFALQKTDMAAIELTQFFRQEDRSFIELLNHVRIGENPGQVADELNRRCSHGGEADTGITLTGTNYLAERINSKELAQLQGKEHSFAGEASGSFGLSGDRLPSPADLRLKVGAHVMFTRNDEHRRWVNGTIGIVKNIEEGHVFVEPVGESRGKVFEVVPTTWKTHRYRYNKKLERIEAREAGKYTQYPLMLAWAVTIHKSQGQTLDNVLLDLGRGAFASGQLYVALSRCRSIGGIHLARPIRAGDVICDPEVKRFHESLGLVAQR